MKETNTRARLLSVLEILRNSDEKHPMTSDRIIGELKRRYGLEAERKAVGLDIKALVEMGEDIISCDYKRNGYFLATHQFENWEVKVLMDAVAQAKFLTAAVTGRLTSKLLATTSPHTRNVLSSATPDSSGVKTKNKATQNNIDILLSAIENRKKVSFTYVSIGTQLKRTPRRGGARYTVSPYALIWKSDYYYLICNAQGFHDFSYYRLDRIEQLSETEDPVRPIIDFAEPDDVSAISRFVDTTIHHYGGKQKIILRLRVPKFMLDHLFDEFGDGLIRTEPTDGEKNKEEYVAVIETAENPGLYFLLLQYGENLEILEPFHVREEYVRRVGEIAKKYGSSR